MNERIIKAHLSNAIASLAHARKEICEGIGFDVKEGLGEALFAIEQARKACEVARIRANQITTVRERPAKKIDTFTQTKETTYEEVHT